MKKILIILLSALTISVSAQCVTEKIYIQIKIPGLIEIGKHIFYNDTCQDPIMYKSTLDNITIYDSKNTYEIVACDKKNCNILHLEKEIKYTSHPSIIYLKSSLKNKPFTTAENIIIK